MFIIKNYIIILIKIFKYIIFFLILIIFILNKDYFLYRII